MTIAENTRPKNALAGQKLAPGFFCENRPKPRPALPPQTLGTHLESATCVYVFVSGCADAPVSGDMWAQNKDGSSNTFRGTDAQRAAAVAYYQQLPADMRKRISDTYLDPNTTIYGIKTTPDGKVVSEWQMSIGRYEKKDGTVYYLATDLVHQESPTDASFATVFGMSPDWKISLKNIVDLHSHPDGSIPGFSFVDRGGYQRGAMYNVSGQNVSVPREYSGVFSGQYQTFYGWTKGGEFSLTFEEMRNALR